MKKSDIFLTIFLLIISGCLITISIIALPKFLESDINIKEIFKNENNNTSNSKSSWLKGEKTTTCTKNINDNDTGSVTESTYKIISKKDIVTLFSNEELVRYNSTSSVKITKNLISSLILSFNNIEGIEAEFTDIDDYSYKTTIKVDYTKLDFEKIKTIYDNSINENTNIYKNNITINDFIDSLKDYNCN